MTRGGHEGIGTNSARRPQVSPLAGTTAEIDDVCERVQVLVKGDEWDAQSLGGRRDEEVHGTPPWVEAPSHTEVGQLSPDAGNLGVNRYGVELGLDKSQSLRAMGSFQGVLGEEQAKVKLGKGHHADRGLVWQKARIIADQDRRVEEGSHPLPKGS